MAHSCSMAMGLVACEPPSSIISKNCTNVSFQGGYERVGIMALATINRFGTRQQNVSATELPAVRRWLQAPPLLKTEMVRRPLLRSNSSNLVICSLPVEAASSSVQIASTMFTLSTAFVVPFYTAMILAPKWKWTKKLVESELPFVVLGVMYIYLLYLSWTPETLGLMFASKYLLPELPGITRMFSSTITVASAWIHLLVADLFCGRYVFLDGLQHNVETRHSLVLCLMMCPIGIVSHVVTKVIMSFARRIDGESTTDMGKVLA